MAAGEFSWSPENQQTFEERRDKYKNGYQLGSGAYIYGPSEDLRKWSATRPDQTNIERIAEQRSNYFYGGSASGQSDALNSLRGNMYAPINNLTGYGSAFFGQSQDAAGRTAPLDAGNLNGAQQGQQGIFGAANQLTTLANAGPGASQAQAQLDASTAMAMRQQLALAGSGRGAGGGASAFRQAAANQAQIQGQANAQASVLRAQEENAWKQTQAGMLASAGGLYGASAEAALNNAQYTTGAQQAQTQLNDQYAQGMGDLALQGQTNAGQLQLGTEQTANAINLGALTGSMGYEGMLKDFYAVNKGVSQQDAALAQQERAANMAMLGTGITALGVMSDIRAKKDIQPAGDEVTDTLRRLGVAPGAGQTTSLAEQFTQNTGVGTPIQSYAGEPIDYDAGAGIYRSADPLRTRGATAGAYHPQLGGSPQPAMPPRLSLEQRRSQAVGAAQALGQTSASSYEYKNPNAPGAADGTHYGPMAQELEKTPVGASTVVTQPDGSKGIDTDRLTLVNTAAVGEQQRTLDEANLRIAELEKMLGKKPPPAAAKPKGKVPPRIKIGEAQIEATPRPSAAAALAEKQREERAQYVDPDAYQEDPRSYYANPDDYVEPAPSIEFGPAEIERPSEAKSKPRGGSTNPVMYSPRQGQLDADASKYGTPVLTDGQAPADETDSILDRLLGRSVGGTAADIANEERANFELRRRFRRPEQEDLYL